jgi:lipopolysaccharide/colanic/teichoic acid biosynthesis glycosyltransferase
MNNWFMKRILDIVGALTGGVLLSPLLAVVWMAVVLESGRPGLFRQRRMGRRGSEFTLYKFRTMTVQRGTERGSFDAGSSARVTRVGKLLRKTKLDEFPQLWNVLVGDMSLVGPRPEVRKWVEAYPDRWAKVLAVRPGITDPASIEFRNEEELLAAAPNPETYYRKVILPRKLDLYEEYVETRSFWGDVGILLKTVWAVAGR